MDSKLHNDDEDDSQLIFQNLTPEKPANTFQRNVIRIQHNWNKRHRLILLTVLSGLLIFSLAFEFIHYLKQQNGMTNVTVNNGPIVTADVSQMFSYNSVIYVLTHQISNNTGQLEALNAKTGKLIWSYSHHNTEGIKLVGNILYIQTDTNLVALNATNRRPIWENQTISDVNYWQTDQGILFTAATNGIVTALSASTGAPLWHTNRTSNFWQVANGIFYTTPDSSTGLQALNAHNGQQLWNNPNILYQAFAIDNDNFYVQDDKHQNLQAFNGQTGKLLWQLNTHGKDLGLVTQNGFLLLNDIQETKVEALNGQTGKLLWQRQGALNILPESPNQTIILPPQKNQTDIVRTTDGSTLYHVPKADELFSIENGIAFFIRFPSNDSNGNTTLIVNIEAVRISTGATIWSSQALDKIPLLQNNTINLVSISNNSLLALRADNGNKLWEHTFNTTTN